MVRSCGCNGTAEKGKSGWLGNGRCRYMVRWGLNERKRRGEKSALGKMDRRAGIEAQNEMAWLVL